MPQDKVYRFLLMVAATAVIIVVIRMASVIVAPMLMALFLAIILLVPIRWLQEKGCPRFLSLVIVIFCTAVIFLGMTRLVITSLNDFIRYFPDYKSKIIRKIEALDRKLEDLGFTIGKREAEIEHPQSDAPPPTEPLKTHERIADAQNDRSDPRLPENQTVEAEKADAKTTAADVGDEKDAEVSEDSDVSTAQTVSETSDDEPDDPRDFDEIFAYSPSMFEMRRERQRPLTELNTESVMYWVGRVVVELRNLMAASFLIMVITIFMIFEAARFPQKIDWAFGKAGPISNRQLHDIANEIRRYLFIKSISCLMSSVAATVVYLCFGVPGAFFWGLVAFFLYFIPNIGGVIASIIPGLLIFMAMDLEGLLLYAVVLISIECAIGYGIEPKMLGHGLGISIVVIFLSLLTWGWILGPVGLFLAAPLTIMLKIILQSFRETEWIAILLGDKYQPDKTE